MSNLGTCCWGHTGHNTYQTIHAPCPAPATHRFESGMSYCDEHTKLVQANRDWLLDRFIGMTGTAPIYAPQNLQGAT